LRLNKYLAETGACSRREADQWIEAGRVTVDGTRAMLGTQVGAGDDVRVDGKPLRPRPKRIYLALNKPIGVECTTDRGVPGNIVDFVAIRSASFRSAASDKDSEGLILLTNDGDIVTRSCAPRTSTRRNTSSRWTARLRRRPGRHGCRRTGPSVR